MKKYKLSSILLTMHPCKDARRWIEYRMKFDTFAEAVEKCPETDWLIWLMNQFHYEEMRALRTKAYHIYVMPIYPEDVKEAAVREFFRDKENLGVLEQALIRHGNAYNVLERCE